MSNQLISKVLDFYITTNCTLNCKLCMTDVPRIPDRHHVPVETLVSELEAYFKIWDHTKRLEFMGGEPLMHPDIFNIVKESLQFQSFYDNMRITTNATIVPDDDLLELIAGCGKHFDFVVDNYGPLSRNLTELTSKLDFYKIPYRVDLYTGENQHFRGWVDLGNYEFHNYSDEELSKMFFECVSVVNKFDVVYEGKVFQCPFFLRLYHIKGILPEKNEYIDLFDQSISISEKKKIASGFYKTPIGVCRYCPGFNETESKRYPAAEQVERK